MFKTKFGIYKANTAAIFVTLAVTQKKPVTFLSFVRFLCSFYQIVGNVMKFKKKNIAGHWKRATGCRALLFMSSRRTALNHECSLCFVQYYKLNENVTEPLHYKTNDFRLSNQ